MKFLFDLFPVILFFIAFKVADIYTATAVAIGATFLQVGWLKLRGKRVEPMLWASLAIIVVFGGATLLLQDETFIKWKPTVLYWLFGGVLAGAIALRRVLRLHGRAQPVRGLQLLDRQLGELQAVRRHGADAGVRRRPGHGAVEVHR